jgi:hypothetical protein
MRLKRWSIAVGYWLLAVFATTLAGSIVQTQFNLAQLVALGQPVDIGLRLQTTLLDLARFAPLFGAIVAVGFLMALPLASWLARRGAGRGWLYPLAGAVALLVALLLMRWLVGLTPIAAAREPMGMAALVLSGAFGGWVWGIGDRSIRGQQPAVLAQKPGA